MTPSARLAAAIEVLTEIEARHRPARLALKDWGSRARYAGSGDRAWVSGLVLDALRRKRSLAFRMGEDSPRAVSLGVLRFTWNWTAEQVAQTAAGQPHGPGELSEPERAALGSPRSLEEAPAAVRGDYPDWLEEPLARAYGEQRIAEAEAQSRRAPVDLRVNSLKGDMERVLKVLGPMGAEPSDLLVNALRLPPPEAHKRPPAVENEPLFVKGAFEVQDQGSQLAAAAAGEVKGRQILDLCAGGGGKTIALAAAMANTGQIYAYDIDAKRLSEVVTRGQRAGVRNLQVRTPSQPDPLHGLDGQMDLVFVDAPCTGSGTWRRHPDAKWRLQPAQLERRMAEQDAVLDQAAACVKPGGRIVYVTCSILCEENEDRVAAFRERRGGYQTLDSLAAIAASGLLADGAAPRLRSAVTPEGFLRLSPRATGTDGFFVAVLSRTG